MPLTARPLAVTLIGIGLSIAVPLTPSVADEPTYRAGKKCTIVGTPGADRLVGTRRTDVICGLGGKDTIIGRGGNDRIVSGAGNDVIRGGAGRDVVNGGPGIDTLTGEGGQDELVGGPDADDMSGGGGQDDLQGGGGNDHLDGGPRPDDLDGGVGSNTCVVGADDAASRCVYDLNAPTVVALEPSATDVDVSAADRQVTVRVRVTDDTGVRSVFVTLTRHGQGSTFDGDQSRLVAGTVRDGWWRSTIKLPRYARSGTYGYSVGMYDQMGRGAAADDFQDVVLNVTSVDDTELPVLESLSAPTPGTVLDVRSRGAQLRVTAHLTDNLSGIGYAYVCATPVNQYIGGTSCPDFQLVSGTARDGTWSVTVSIPEGAVSDQWKLRITIVDRANPSARASYYPDIEWWGPHISPAGYGVFDVIGSDPPEPTQDPEVATIDLTPTTVDTLANAATVSGTVTFDDPDAVVTRGELALQQTQPGGYTGIEYVASLIRGADGLWRAQVVLARGAPPGRYQARVIAYDSRGTGHIRYLDAYVTVVDSRT